jgi:hypothetical protein
LNAAELILEKTFGDRKEKKEEKCARRLKLPMLL